MILSKSVFKNKKEIKIEDLSNGSHILVLVKCDYCDNEREIPYKKYTKSIINNGKYSCSYKCRTLKTKEINLEKYGNSCNLHSIDGKSKVEKTMLERYGVDNYAKSNEYKEKTKKTNIDKYEVEYFFQSSLFKELSKTILLERYGVDSYAKSDEFKERYKNTCINKYGVLNSSQYNSIISSDTNYIKYLNNGISLFKCNKCDSEFEMKTRNYYGRLRNNLPLCTLCNPIGSKKSIKEDLLFDFIKENYNDKVIQSYRDGLEIDIYLPKLNLGFEFNGLYFHSEKFRDNNYHLNKTEYFKDKGLRIIHIWEDDWMFKEDIVKSQVLNFLNKSEKIYARQCVIKELKSATYFLNNNHIQGVDKSNIKIGLFYNDELVSIMTFNLLEGRIKMKEGEYNLSRFCNKLGYNVVGGASKMLSYFEKNYKPSRIISYADKDWSVGNLYYTLGFKNVSETKPDYKYIIDGKRKHKQNFKKSNLKIKDITESKYMKDNGYLKIYDCGKIKFEKLLDF